MAKFLHFFYKFFIYTVINNFKKFNFKFFLYIIIIAIFLLYFNLFLPETVRCYPIYKNVSFLQKHIVGGHNVYVYKNINTDIVYELMYKIKYLNYNLLNYDIVMYNNVDGVKLPRWHPLSHYHLNFLELNKINPNIYVNMQFSHSNFNNFNLLNDYNLYGFDKYQYISNNFYFYEKKEVKINFEKSFKFNLYLNNYKNQIYSHTNEVKDLYKI